MPRTKKNKDNQLCDGEHNTTVGFGSICSKVSIAFLKQETVN
jgi:hypothetical protein